MGRLSLDIVVPTVRLDSEKLTAIAKLKVPDEMAVHCYFIVDKPNGTELIIPPQMDKKITVIRNDKNLGGSVSRNKGLEAGEGEYVLFLDDDVEVPDNLLESYLEAIKQYPQAPGFVGSTRFPPCVNSFTRAALASDILTFWDIAEWQPSLGWGVTANLLVKREAVGGLRFSPKFPKRGGGEDVDFCLRIVKKSGGWFVSFPQAMVIHPWWQHGKHQYRRFARWAYGDSTLPRLHPEFKFRNAPNLIETAILLLSIALAEYLVFGKSLAWLYAWIGPALFFEFIMDGLRMKLREKRQSPSVSIQATSIRLANDLGRIAGHVRHFHISGITERFDYFMTSEHISYERKIAILKFSVFFLTSLIFVILSQK